MLRLSNIFFISDLAQTNGLAITPVRLLAMQTTYYIKRPSIIIVWIFYLLGVHFSTNKQTKLSDANWTSKLHLRFETELHGGTHEQPNENGE